MNYNSTVYPLHRPVLCIKCILDLGYFQLLIDLSGHNSVGSVETSVLITSRTPESQQIIATELSTSHCLQTARNIHKR